MRSICQGFPIQLPIFKLEIPDKYCRHRSCAIINQRQKHSFFDDNRQQVCGLLKNYSVFLGKFCSFLLLIPKMVVDDRV